MLLCVAYVSQAWSVADHTSIVGFGMLKSSTAHKYPATGLMTVSFFLSFLSFCIAVLDPRVGHTMDVLSRYLASCFLYSLESKSIKCGGYLVSIIVTQSLSCEIGPNGQLFTQNFFVV